MGVPFDRAIAQLAISLEAGLDFRAGAAAEKGTARAEAWPGTYAVSCQIRMNQGKNNATTKQQNDKNESPSNRLHLEDSPQTPRDTKHAAETAQSMRRAESSGNCRGAGLMSCMNRPRLAWQNQTRL